MKFVSPSIKATAFNCAHCGALTTQSWYRLNADPYNDEYPLPPYWTKERATTETFDEFEDPKQREGVKRAILALAEGTPVFHDLENWRSCKLEVLCLNISQCFNCKELSIWLHDHLLYPAVGEAPPPNPDLPAHIRADYSEANSILSFSPRGAAALLRLAIQKLCVEFGESGKDINKDIGKLVEKGLDTKVQKALDIVRVIGNEAVHPGTIDLKDDTETAQALFKLVNLIAEKMISEPKEIDALFGSLPEAKRKGIEARDKNTNSSPKS